jgi:hypothetical protein
LLRILLESEKYIGDALISAKSHIVQRRRRRRRFFSIG